MHTVSFLSEQNEDLHRAYLASLQAKLSILQKSDSRLAGKNALQIASGHLRIRSEALNLAKEILLHESFFTSFLHPSPFSFAKGYRDADLRYRILSADDGEAQFLLVALSADKPVFRYFGKVNRIPLAVFSVPHCTVDLCEHSFFADFGFDRHTYLRTAIASLDFKKLESEKDSKG